VQEPPVFVEVAWLFSNFWCELNSLLENSKIFDHGFTFSKWDIYLEKHQNMPYIYCVTNRQWVAEDKAILCFEGELISKN
jgi:hypothetical protein